MSGVTYKISPNKAAEFYYVGSTMRFHERMKTHLNLIRQGKHENHRLQKAWDESNSDGFKVTVVLRGTIEEAQLEEAKLLEASAEDDFLCNIATRGIHGTDFSRLKDPEATKAKMSEATQGSKNGMFGYRHSEETKKRMSDLRKGVPRYDLRGIPLSAETRAKVSATKRANPATGVKNPFYGRKHTPEVRELIRSKLKGKVSSPVNKLEIDGVLYESQAEAARALNVSNALITYRIKNPEKYPGYKVVMKSVRF